MRLLNITATAHPQGNRIDLSFLNPHPALYSQIQIRRGTHSHPTRFIDGQLVQEVKLSALLTWQPAEPNCIDKLDQAELCEALRTQLISQEIILTAAPLITPLTTELPWRQWQLTDHAQDYVLSYHPDTKILQLHEYKIIFVKDTPLQSETVYYYTLFTFPEPYFDPEQRVSAMATGPYQFGEQLYQLLPNLYHRYDTTISPAAAEPTLGQLRRWLELPGMQLDQLYSFATALLKLSDREQVEGSLLPLLAQWIGWQLDRNQAVATWRNEIRGAPELYRTIGIIPTVEAAVKRLLGWESRIKEYHYNILRTNIPERFNLWELVDSKASLLSLDFAYEGRPAVVTTTETSWLFYHTRRHQQWEISYKTLTNEQWSPSQPLTVNSAFINKQPTAVSWQNQLWVFWNAYDETQGQWQIHYCYQIDKTWSPVYRFDSTPNTVARQQPAAVVDDAERLWLFWLEQQPTTSWELKYARLDNPAGILPPTAGTATGKVRIQDLFVLFDPARKKFWVFWSERQLTPAVALDAAVPAEAQLISPCRPVTAQTPNQTHWQISYQVLDSTAPTWGESQELPRPAPPNAPAAYDDREPAAVVNNSGQIELVWSSNRGSSYSGGSGSIWRQQFDFQTETWLEPAEMLTRDPYSQRTPVPFQLPDKSMRIIYRSNESLTYQSERYGATQTTDFRYAGCTTVDTCNQTKSSLRDQFGDFQSYTFDTGHNAQGSYENNKYDRGRIGIYLTPSSQGFAINPKVLKNSLKAFLPLQVRPLLFINDFGIYDEWVYTYQAPKEIPQKVIAEQWFDQINNLLTTDSYSGLEDDYQDKIPQWSWLYTAWTAGGSNPWSDQHRTVNFGAEPPPPLVTRFRSWHIGIDLLPLN
jgi:Phage tail protein (Tail_P2_I)